MGLAAGIVSNLLLFLLVFGMSATVDMGHMRAQMNNRKAFVTGLFLQFVVLPFLGFCVVKALALEPPLGITLLVITSSPGGSYSNWWCSLFNADLALSVAMTAISTILSVAMLPLNLYIYASSLYQNRTDVMDNLDWSALFIALTIVIGAIGAGLLCSAKENSPTFNLYANRFGNIAGISLILMSTIFASGESGNKNIGIIEVWQQSPRFYFGVATPCICGLVLANVITSCFTRIKKPERVTTAVECCYQNIGIATSVAISMFSGSDRSAALAVPLFYGIVEAVVLGIYCIWAWKKGWTFAPKDDPFCKVILHSYQIDPHIVKVSGSDQTPDDTTQQSEGEASSSRHAQFISVATTSSAYPVRPYRERLDEEIEVPSWVT